MDPIKTGLLAAIVAGGLVLALVWYRALGRTPPPPDVRAPRPGEVVVGFGTGFFDLRSVVPIRFVFHQNGVEPVRKTKIGGPAFHKRKKL